MSSHLARLAVLLALVAPMARAADPLYDEFREPPAHFRPFVRWWWNGGCVTEKEILRELEVLKAAGIGGFEINTIAMPEGAASGGCKALSWLSPEWNHMVRAAAQGARERGLVPDVIVGSGWPFGGRFLAPSEQTKRVRVVKKVVQGPAEFSGEVSALAGEHRREREEVSVPVRLVDLRLVPAAASEFAPGASLPLPKGGTGRIRARIPKGEYTLFLVLLEEGFTHVKLGAPGADGPVVDHYNAGAVRHYLEHMSSALSPSFDGRLGSLLRAAFVDSLELDHANWTGDLPSEFAKRRGYELEPYLPFVLDPDVPKAGTPRSDTIHRARYDFILTLTELFQERFLGTYTTWARANGLLARIQAYGRETHPLDGAREVDLPEGETWFWSDHDRITVAPTVVNKYVSSGAHLAGRRVVSFEAMTNAVPAFREQLSDMKLGLDASLLSGVVHPVLHGFNYTPPDAGYPGWVRFGCYFNEKSAWWKHFPLWSAYSARLTSVFAQSDAVADIAILGPRPDEWTEHGMLYQPFPEISVPWYHYGLWQAFQQAGFGTDFVSEKVVAESRNEEGRLVFGTRSYRALVVMGARSMEPKVAAAIERHAKGGGVVIFVGRAPERSPGLANAQANDTAVREAVAGALAQKARVAVVEAPRRLATQSASDETRAGLSETDKRTLLSWVLETVPRFALAPDVRISAPHTAVSQVHYKTEDRDIHFFANTGVSETVSFEARFPVADQTPWRWDPETGSREPYPWTGQRGVVPVSLGPAESLLLVFEKGAASEAPPPRGLAPAAEWLTASAPWTVEFAPVGGGEHFTRSLRWLADLSLFSEDRAVADFAGTATYRSEIAAGSDGFDTLDLGNVQGVSSVRWNGKPLGTRWYGHHTYDVSGLVRKGRNDLEVEVTTQMANYTRSLKENKMAQRWTSWFPPIPAGLLGPVRLVKAARP